MQDDLSKQQENGKEKPENHINVAVVTTSGSIPAEGFQTVPAHQKVSVFLKKACKDLNIVSTDGWIARVDDSKRTIDVQKSYLENQLLGMVNIDFGPPEGGGGNE